MRLSSITLLLLISVSFCLSFSEQESSFYEKIYKFFEDRSDPSITYYEQFSNCSEAFSKISPQNMTAIFDYTGKQFGELGNEDECGELKLTYFLLLYDLNLTFLANTDNGKVLNYLNKTHYYTGVCILPQCVDFMIMMFNSTYNKPFTEYLSKEMGMDNTSILLDFDYISTLYDRRRKISYFDNVCFSVYTILSLTFVSIMLIASILKIILFFSFQITKRKLKHKNTQVAIIRGASDEDYFSSSSYSKRSESEVSMSDGLLFGSKTINKEQMSSSQLLKIKLIKICSKFDLIYNFQCLFSIKNKYYNDTGIELFGFVRMIVMLFLTYNHNIYSMLDIPGKDQYNEEFYTSVFTVLIRASTYAPVCWIVLDGAEMAYKIMNYYKRDAMKQSLTIKTYLKFVLFAIPKMCLVLYVFYYFFLLNNTFTHYIADLGTLYDYYGEFVLNKRDCYEHPYYIFIPFWTGYQSMEDRGYANCYRFVSVFTNEIYFIIIVGFLLFISFKVKSMIYDVILSLIVLLNTALIFLSYYSYDSIGNSITFFFNLGQNYTEKFPHLMINFYFIGTLLGICYFYYNDAVDEQSLAQTEEKLPFQFCLSIISFLDVLTPIMKKITLFILVCLITFISSTIFISYLYYGDYSFKVTLYHVIDDLYSKEVFLILFAFVFVMLITYPRESTFKHLVQTNIFVMFERINTAFFSINDLIIYFSYCVFHFQLKLSYQNIFFTTIGLWVLVVIFSILLTIIIEMTIRKGIKSLLSLCKEDEKRSEEEEEEKEEEDNKEETKTKQNFLNVD